MASLSEIMVQNQMESSDPMKFVKAPDYSEAYAQGAQLALKKQELVQTKSKLEHDMAQAKMAGIGKVTDFLFKASDIKDRKAQANYLRMGKSVRDGYGVSPAILSDEAIDSLGSEEDSGRAYTLNMAVKTPGNPLFGKPEMALQIYNDPEQRIKITSTPLALRGDSNPDLNKTTSEYLEYQAKQQQLAQNSAQFQQGQAATERRAVQSDRQQLTKELNTAGIPSIKRDITRLDKLLGGLDNWKGEDIPGVTGTEAKIPMNKLPQKSVQIRQAAQGIANQILKLRSGGAVSDGEANRLLKEIGMTSSVLEDGSWSTLFTGSPTPQTFITGMRGVRDKIGSIENTMSSGYGAQVYKEVAGAPLKVSSEEVDQPAAKTVPQDDTIAKRIDNTIAYVKSNLAAINKQGGAAALRTRLESRGLTKEQVDKIITAAGVK